METASSLVLIVVGMVAFNAYRQGRFGDWLRAKFLNAAQPSVPLGQIDDDDAGDGTVTPGVSTQPAGGLTGLLAGIGNLLRPVNSARVSGAFGEDRGTHLHEGVDFAAPAGAPVVAAAGGRVTYAANGGSYGNRVDVDHGNGVVTRYAHLDRIDVRQGQTVNPGQQVGVVGSTGRSTGPHLHFEARRQGEPFDPTGLFGSFGQVSA